jgi:flagellin-specific chaperone FliS
MRRHTLRQLYEYFDRRLQESNVQKKSHGTEEVIRHLTELRDAWATMLSQKDAPPREQLVPSVAFATA